MDNKEFYYHRYALRCILLLPIVAVAFLVEYLLGGQAELNLAARLGILAAALVLDYIWYLACGSLPFLKGKGTYGTQGGNLWIARGKGRRMVLSDVYEVYIVEKHMIGVNIALLHISYGREQLELYSLPMAKGTGYRDTELYPVFEKLLARNPKLRSNQEYFGSTEGKWYKI